MAALAEHAGGDDLVAADSHLVGAVTAPAGSEYEPLRRPWVPLAERLALGTS
jgi:hypothetical protein